MADADALRTKVEGAVEATRSFVAILDAEGLKRWADRFRDIQRALEAGDLKGAIQLLSTTKRGGMGGLSDVMAKDQRSFDHAWSNCSKAIGSVRLYISYGIDRSKVRADDA